MVGACGDDSNAMVDAPPFVVEHDLTCLGNEPPSAVADALHLDSVLINATNFERIANGMVTVSSLDGTTQVATATTNAEGEFALDLTNTAALPRLRYAFEATGFPNMRSYMNLPEWRSTSTYRRRFFGFSTSEAVNIATTLGTTLDPTKGALQVWMTDCERGDFAGEMITIADEPDAQWAHWSGNNVWVPRMTTIRPAVDRSESVAATVNLSPGLKTISVTAGGNTIGTTFYIEPDTITFLLLVPGFGDYPAVVDQEPI